MDWTDPTTVDAIATYSGIAATWAGAFDPSLQGPLTPIAATSSPVSGGLFGLSQTTTVILIVGLAVVLILSMEK